MATNSALLVRAGSLERLQSHLAEAPRDREEIRDLFYRACKHGHVNVARWLFEAFALTAPDAAKGQMRDGVKRAPPYRVACWKGHLDVVQWLFGALPGTFENDPSAFTVACAGEHLAVAQWLLGASPTLRDNRRLLVNIFWMLCARGRLEAAKWLASIVRPGGDDLRVRRRYPNGLTGPGCCLDCCD